MDEWIIKRVRARLLNRLIDEGGVYNAPALSVKGRVLHFGLRNSEIIRKIPFINSLAYMVLKRVQDNKK